MTPFQTLAGSTLLMAVGIWLLLPRGRAGGRAVGVVLTAIGLGLVGSVAIRFDREHPIAEGVFLLLATTTIVSAIGAVTMRSPVYCAIWFALTLLGTAGLFLYQGAQFLGVATVVVYAGAILVTFLFVLMLAQPKGQTSYDRVSWEGLLSASTGALLVAMLSTVIFLPRSNAGTAAAVAEEHATEAALDLDILHPDHMAHLGRELFSRHLLAVEFAGTLLLVALVGAIAVVAHGKQAPRLSAEEHFHG
jgi:NADH-quinone oxidoreductase subunit J